MITILFVLYRECSILPHLFNSLCVDYHLKVISLEDKCIEKNIFFSLYDGKNLDFLSTITKEDSHTVLQRVTRKIKRLFIAYRHFTRKQFHFLTEKVYVSQNG